MVRAIGASSFLRHSSVLYFLSELPKTATGKVQKYVLRGKPAISKQ
jgi:acyl-coenzyme A synthetase/AMP-(fatty) acid ligase